MTEKRRWWDPARHGARRDKLMARNALKGDLRSFFTDRGFIEVDVGCVAVSPGNETHLTAFQTEFVPALGHSQRPQKLFLHTSPEFACKKLIAAGERALFTFAPTFRNGEVSPRHSPEFTMLEWYQAGAAFEDLLQQMAGLIETVAMAGTDTVTIHDRTIPLDNGVDRITVCDAFVRYSDVDLAAHLRDAPFDCGDLAERANTANIRTSDDDDWSDVFSKIMTGIEPMLGLEKPVLLTHYPAPEAALARLSDADPNVAERVEFYIGGVEIANGYAELVDVDALEARLTASMDEMERRYGRRYALDPEFIEAVGRMPATVGCALGFDRLAMLVAGADTIHDVIWTPFPGCADGFQ